VNDLFSGIKMRFLAIPLQAFARADRPDPDRQDNHEALGDILSYSAQRFAERNNLRRYIRKVQGFSLSVRKNGIKQQPAPVVGESTVDQIPKLPWSQNLAILAKRLALKSGTRVLPGSNSKMVGRSYFVEKR
jgi:hypothetical protein